MGRGSNRESRHFPLHRHLQEHPEDTNVESLNMPAIFVPEALSMLPAPPCSGDSNITHSS